MSSVIKQYDTKVDSKNRLTIRDSHYNYYHVIEFENGKIELQPRVLVDPEYISKNTLSMMDKSIENLKSGNVSEPINISEFVNDI
jgi:hypothetical protein